MSGEYELSKYELMAIQGEFGEYLAKPLTKQERMEVVGEAMEATRKRAGFTQKDLCDVIRCKPQTYSGYEKGKYEPSLELLVRLSHLYDVSLDYLLGKYDGIEELQDEWVTLKIAEEIENPSPEILANRLYALEHQFAEMKAKYGE
ncbi:helix-turn-helix transcriptional regulator [Bengtsoniella intestinalis]|uniref:helix-turn-helix domain-containing protein n=1 Tax=Bengtsoniella intestinalis TaxID=3073143 RepID=UPI00391F43DE